MEKKTRLEKPFKTLRQYQKYIGKQVEVKTKENEKISGKLLSFNSEGIELEVRSKEKLKAAQKGKQLIINNINLTFNQIKETKVVVSF